MDTKMEQHKGRAMAWDPKSPATLLLPSVDSTAVDPREACRVDTFLSHDGVGCNSQESSALVNLLDAQNEYLDSKSGKADSLKFLSKSYRKALCECLMEWDKTLTEKNDKPTDMEITGTDATTGNENLELLKLVYAVTQLSEAFLLTPATESTLEHYETTFSMPGAVTADTVRYLRLHHMPDAYAVADTQSVDDVLESLQPEQMGGDGAIYWRIVEAFAVRGCLEDVWALLARHSLCRRCFDDSLEPHDEYHATTIAEDREGFLALRSLLLSAPLPGGRTDIRDSSFEDSYPSDEDYEDDELLEGIPMSAYRLWEARCSSRGMGDYPISFNPHAATKMHQDWVRYISTLDALNTLKHRIPQLDALLSILLGDFKKVKFDSWAEALCAELLYERPSVRPEDIHIRASRAMEKLDAAADGGFEEVVLSIMRGNAGRVIEVLHELGGGSGAALPAVMTSLLCNLLTDAQALPTPSESYTLQTELLLNSSFATQSSLATKGQYDLGARLAVRVLLPYAKPEGDLQITAMIAETLEHHTPQSDDEANSLLSLCRGLVERKNVRVLDGCVSVALSRYRHYLEEQRPGGAVHWLLTGMEFESLVLCGSSETGAWQRDLSAGVCFRILVTSSLETAKSLLTGMLGDEEGVALVYARAKEMVSAHEESRLTAFIPEVKVLSYIVGIAKAIVKQTDEHVVASNIVACLEEKPNEEDDGIVSTLARPTMHWDLLRLAQRILDRNENRNEFEKNQIFTSSFDVRGMQVLQERFTAIVASRKVDRLKDLPEEEVKKMRLALGNGLMRAFVAENSKKKKPSTGNASNSEIAGICAVDLGKHGRDTQEKVVAMMLNF